MAPGKALDQRALAGPVFAEQRVDLTCTQAKRHVVERDDARELLADSGHLEPHLRREGFRFGAHCLLPAWRVELAEIRSKVLMSLRRARPRTTAPRISAPMRNCTQKGSALTSTRPSSISEMRTIASTVPRMGALPPASAAPPMIGPAKEGSTHVAPMVGWPCPSWAMSIVPAIAARKPEMACAVRVARRMGRPDRRAARALPPTASSCLPSTTWERKNASSSASTIVTAAMLGNGPRRAWPNALISLGM